MQAPTQNGVTQGKHGNYNAVDYSSSPDIFYYAPEDGVIESVVRNNGDCGYSFNLRGGSGVHGFCHNEELFVSNGQRVVRGQRIAKMGYTGKTIPSGPAGRHLHWILNRGGAWVYPPSLVNEAFKKEGGEQPMNEGDVINMYQSLLDRKPDPSGLAAAIGQPWKQVFYGIVNSKEFVEHHWVNKGDVVNFNASKAGLGDKMSGKIWKKAAYDDVKPVIGGGDKYTPVTEQLFKKG